MCLWHDPYLTGVKGLSKILPWEQALQHFGVRQHWRPLREPPAADMLRRLCGGPRMLVDNPVIISPQFWNEEVRHACDCY